MPEKPNILNAIFGGTKRLANLYFEAARLKVTEKITILLAAIAFYAVTVALSLVCLVFISIGLGQYLAMHIDPFWAYLFIAGFYFLLIILAFLLKRQIFLDPIAHFISRLLVELPEELKDDVEDVIEGKPLE